EGAVGRLGGKAFVVVVVADDHQLGARGVEVAPGGARHRVHGDGARAEQRVVPVGQGARPRVRGQIRLEPLLLRRSRPHRDVRVQGDDVPGAEVVAVVALGGVAGGGAEVAVVARGAGGVVVVVARHRAGARFEPAPGGRVAVRVV